MMLVRERNLRQLVMQEPMCKSEMPFLFSPKTAKTGVPSRPLSRRILRWSSTANVLLFSSSVTLKRKEKIHLEASGNKTCNMRKP